MTGVDGLREAEKRARTIVADWRLHFDADQDEPLVNMIATSLTAWAEGVAKEARRKQQLWDRSRAEDYAAVVGVDLTPSDDFMDAVDELYRANADRVARERAAEELRDASVFIRQMGKADADVLSYLRHKAAALADEKQESQP